MILTIPPNSEHLSVIVKDLSDGIYVSIAVLDSAGRDCSHIDYDRVKGISSSNDTIEGD